MSREENFETYLKEKYANEEKEQNTETDSPNFRVGFLEFTCCYSRQAPWQVLQRCLQAKWQRVRARKYFKLSKKAYSAITKS